MLHRSLLVALGCSLGLCGCLADDDGSSLGRFQVEATLTESCAETGLLAAPAERSFVVYLRRVSDRAMHWDDGETLMYCSIADDGRSFTAERRLLVDMRQGDPVDKPPCEIARVDTIDGELRDFDGRGFGSFTGFARYEYAPTAGSSCDDLLQGPQALAAILPCAVAYDLQAELLQR